MSANASEHPGKCALDYTAKGDHVHLLSCTRDARHRYVLRPRSRNAVMTTLLEAGLLTGQAERDARAIVHITALANGRANSEQEAE